MSVQRPLRPRSAMTPCWSTESLRKPIRRMGHMRDEARVCDEEGALVLVLGEGKLEKGEPSGLEGAAMRLKRKQRVNAILLRGLLLLRLRAGRPIPIVILGLVLGAEKGSDINVSRALAPAGCA